jgi:pimeloyl-ACP methyl ester carboxylesterase
MDGPFAETKELLVGYWPARAGRYAPVNGLQMYYEVHGRGRPLVLLHAGLTTIDTSFGQVLSAFAGSRRVIAIEQQAHGRTADIDRALTYEQMADDTAELLRQLEVEEADFFGYSMGGAVALHLAVQHPALTRKLAVIGAPFNNRAFTPQLREIMSTIDSNPAVQPLKQAFVRVSPSPDQWSAAQRRLAQAFDAHGGLTPDQLRSIRAPTLVVAGETGVIHPEHTAQMVEALPHSQLAMLPMNDHAPGVVERSAELMPAFLDAPLPRTA